MHSIFGELILMNGRLAPKSNFSILWKGEDIFTLQCFDVKRGDAFYFVLNLF